MANRFTLRIMKFFVDLLYYAIPFFNFLLILLFWAFVFVVGICLICIIL